jgi:membrane fusion protein (multidrug efflux system)
MTMSANPPESALKAIAESANPKPRFTKQHKLAAIVAGGAVSLIGLAVYLYIAAWHETTDDAYTTGNVHNISSRVAGTVIEVDVDDNQFVRKGQVLIRLDPRDFQVQVDKARADYNRAKADFDRVAALRTKFNGDVAISQEEYDQIQANLGVAKAALDDALNQLDYSTITAPADGRVGDRTVRTGNRLAVGTVVMSVVEDVWVVANYKETQVGEMLKGQAVQVSVDEIPGHTFTGHIDSFSPGSGSVFALLPPENATGNFTKIVQRVPVKIVFDATSIRGYEDKLVPGLSVETNVHLIKPEAAVSLTRNSN